MTTQVLGVHRDYACQHAGACCGSGWTIPVEVSRYDALAEAIRTGGLTAPGGDDAAPLVPFPARAGDYGGLLGVCEDGCCAFLERVNTAGSFLMPRPACAVHRQLGHAALPLSCQQFPRVAVMRPASTAVSLSHYCPTAAALLFRSEGALAVERGPATLVDEHVWEGLDVREALPPLLRHDALFTWTAFDRWEQFVVAMLADPAQTLEEAVATLAAAAEALREWRLEHGPLDAFVEDRLRGVRAEAHHAQVPTSASTTADEAIRLVSLAIPPGVQQSFTPSVDLRVERATREGSVSDAEVLRRYLAARVWASWVAHESGGVRGYVRWILVVLGTLRGCWTTSLFDAIRHADLLLLHLASPAAIARVLARADRVSLTAPHLTTDGGLRARSGSAGRKPRVPVK